MSEIYCKKCGQSWMRLACLALLVYLGCSTTASPDICREDGGEHEWVQTEIEIKDLEAE